MIEVCLARNGAYLKYITLQRPRLGNFYAAHGHYSYVHFLLFHASSLFTAFSGLRFAACCSLLDSASGDGKDYDVKMFTKVLSTIETPTPAAEN